jgi:hypothetical protein
MSAGEGDGVVWAAPTAETNTRSQTLCLGASMCTRYHARIKLRHQSPRTTNKCFWITSAFAGLSRRKKTMIFCLRPTTSVKSGGCSTASPR